MKIYSERGNVLEMGKMDSRSIFESVARSGIASQVVNTRNSKLCIKRCEIGKIKLKNGSII